MKNKSGAYHAILDLLDRGQQQVAAARFYDFMSEGRLDRDEFLLLIAAFERRVTRATNVQAQAVDEAIDPALWEE